MNGKVFLILLLIIGAGLAFGSINKPKTNSKNQNSIDNAVVQAASKSSLESQSQSMGAVEVEVTPKVLEPGENPVFELSLNTHSVDLDYDYLKIIGLGDNTGKTYNPSEWTGEVGGHHLSGEVHFGSPLTEATTITLTIDGINNQTASFVWNL